MSDRSHGTRAVGELRAVRDFDYAVPTTWCPIPTRALDSGWEAIAAERLCDGEDNRGLLADRLRETHPTLIEDPHQDLAVWVPDRETPQVAGVMLADLLASEPGHPADREHYRALIDPDPRTWCVVYSQSIEDVDLAAGPALLVREVISKRGSMEPGDGEMLEEHVIYTVFPASCSQALQLTFWSPALELGEILAEDAAAMAETLSITLEGASG